jgi:hypothetical protein
MLSLLETVTQKLDCEKIPLQNESHGFVGSTTVQRSQIVSKAIILSSAIRSGNGDSRDAYLNKHLIQLNQCHILPQTLPLPLPKNQLQLLLQMPYLLQLTFKEPLRPEHIRIFSLDFPISENTKCTVPNGSVSQNEYPVNLITSKWNFLHHESYKRMPDARPFFNNYLEVG